jgi:DNA-binding transcriptional MerR regulator
MILDARGHEKTKQLFSRLDMDERILAGHRIGFSMATIRFYAAKGLLGPVNRTTNGRRSFGHIELACLKIIACCRDAGTSLNSIQQLSARRDGTITPCEVVRQLVDQRIAEVRGKIEFMKAFVSNLETLPKKCSSGCCGAVPSECVVFQYLNCCGAHGE